MKTIIRLMFLASGFVLLFCSNPVEKKQAGLPENNEEKESSFVEYVEANKTIYGCEELPSSFSSYEEALRKITNANFRYQDNISITSSSWIRSASYYSCDGNTGFFIIKTDKQFYIHRDLPISVWKSFKSSTSFGSYYSHNIKSEYQLLIN
jgi:hypothetical protein